MTFSSLKKFLISKWGFMLLIFGVCVFSVLIVTKIYAVIGVLKTADSAAQKPKAHLFPVQSIDTMKQSRDMAEQVRTNPRAFDSMIDEQMTLIANTGATHVAIDTPYDAHFSAVLKQWVLSARAHGLSVWFRGNFSGWEGWFGYPRIGRNAHKVLLVSFLESNKDLFESGDIFTPCPECENGGSGDPRRTHDTIGYRNFLTDEYTLAKQAFERMNKSVTIYTSMNADIARLSIDPETAQNLGGTILIDHYSPSAKGFLGGITSSSHANTVLIGLGEFGAPIPDLNGKLSESDQSAFISSLFKILYERSTSTPAVNYWVLEGGSSAIVENAIPRKAYFVVQNYYSAPSVYGNMYNSIGEYLGGVHIAIASTTYAYDTSESGFYQIFLPKPFRKLTITKDGYTPLTLELDENLGTTTPKNFVLEPENPDPWYQIRKFLYSVE